MTLGTFKIGSRFDRTELRFAFDFFGTLDTHEDVRVLARGLFAAQHQVHIVSSISPGLPFDNDESYTAALGALKVPFTKIWRVDHNSDLKLNVLREIRANAFWDDVKANVDAARAAGFSTCHVGVDPHHTTQHVEIVKKAWLLETP